MILDINTLPPEIQATCDDVMLAVPTPDLVYNLATMYKRLAEKGGTQLLMPRYARWAIDPVPLAANGAPKPPTASSRVDILAKVDLYGQYVAINQRVVMSNQDLVLAEQAELAGLAMRETQDRLTQDVLIASASYYNFTNGNNGDNPSNVNAADLQEIAAILSTNNCRKIMNNKEGMDRFGTAPVRSAYAVYGHTMLQKDLNNLTGYIPKWNYANQQDTLEAEHGNFEDFRFFLSSVGSVVPNASNLGNDVYNFSFVGYEAVAAVEQDSFASQFVYRGREFSDALMQNVTLGYVTSWVSAVVNDLWCVTGAVTLS